MKTQSRIIKQREYDIHGYDKRLKQVYRLLERDLSHENYNLIKKYDQMFVQQSLAKAYRCRNLNALLTLTRMLNKNWIDATKNDIDSLVFSVVQTYSDHKGQETNSTADTKKYLKMFFRWIKLGSKEFREVGDPPETKDIRIRLVADKLVRENLVEKSDYDQHIFVDTETIKNALAILKGHVYTFDAEGRLIVPVTTSSVADLSKGLAQALEAASAPTAEDTDSVQVLKVRSRIILKADANLVVGQNVDLKAVTSTTTVDKCMAGVSPNTKGHLGKIFEILTEGTDQARKQKTADNDLVIIDTGVALY